MFAKLKRALGLSRRKSRKAQRGGQSCTEQVAADSSLPQGEAFLKMNQKYHGGSRKYRARKMRGGAADLTAAFEPIPADIHEQAGTAVLDKAIADLAKFTPQTAQTGGALSGSPVDAPTMLLRPEDEAAAFLNPQWVQENVVNPNFQGPASALVQAPTGGARKSRKARKARKSRKARKMGKKSRKMKGGKSRKARKTRKH
jgi:hypothetical protein